MDKPRLRALLRSLESITGRVEHLQNRYRGEHSEAEDLLRQAKEPLLEAMRRLQRDSAPTLRRERADS